MDHYEVIEDALIYIENHIQEPLSLDSVANAFNMSKYYFHRLFSALTGCTLNHYILSRRLNASLKFIQNDHVSLTEIAYMLNFGTSILFHSCLQTSIRDHAKFSKISRSAPISIANTFSS